MTIEENSVRRSALPVVSLRGCRSSSRAPKPPRAAEAQTRTPATARTHSRRTADRRQK